MGSVGLVECKHVYPLFYTLLVTYIRNIFRLLNSNKLSRNIAYNKSVLFVYSAYTM